MLYEYQHWKSQSFKLQILSKTLFQKHIFFLQWAKHPFTREKINEGWGKGKEPFEISKLPASILLMYESLSLPSWTPKSHWLRQSSRQRKKKNHQEGFVRVRPLPRLRFLPPFSSILVLFFYFEFIFSNHPWQEKVNPPLRSKKTHGKMKSSDRYTLCSVV